MSNKICFPCANSKDISLTPIEIVMRDDKLDNTNETNFNINVNLHPTDGTHWVLVIRRENGPVYYFDSFGVETPPFFLEKYDDLGSNERIQQYDESYCGVFCLYMIYLIDRGFRIKSASNVLVNHIKCPEIYNECFCLGCHVNVNDNQGTCFADDLRSSFANQGICSADSVNDSVKDLPSSFANQATDGVRGMPTYPADNDNVNDNDLRSSFANKDNDNDNDLRSSFANKDNDNDNDLRSSFANSDNDKVINLRRSFADNVIYQLDEKHGEKWQAKPHQKGKPNTISININEDLQSWLNDD